MTQTASTKSQLIDDACVMIEEMGGARALVEGLREYHEIVVRMRRERVALMEEHPNRWVAMGKNGVLAVGDSMDAVLDEVEGRGIRSGDIVIEFLDTDPPLLIL